MGLLLALFLTYRTLGTWLCVITPNTHIRLRVQRQQKALSKNPWWPHSHHSWYQYLFEIKSFQEKFSSIKTVKSNLDTQKTPRGMKKQITIYMKLIKKTEKSEK